MDKKQKNILWFNQLSLEDVPLVGGKNASLGEMYSELSRKGVNIPNGFTLTSRAYWYYLKYNGIDKKLKEIFLRFNPKDLKSLQETGKTARNLILKADFPEDLKKEIIRAYQKLGKEYGENPDVAVRSSATAEDLPSASFAGQHETYLNIQGQDHLLKAIKKCMASLFTDRAISYREGKGFNHLKIALSTGVMKMVRSDLASSGVIFTLDTETGFKDVVMVNAIFGIGEMIVKGKITPDQFYVFKPTLNQGYKSIFVRSLERKSRKYIYAKGGGIKEVKVLPQAQIKFSLTDQEVIKLARWAQIIENHYSKKAKRWMPQDIEWAKDGKPQQLFVVQSRPETVHATQIGKFYEEYELKTKEKPILAGLAIGGKIGQGKLHIIPEVSRIGEFKKGEILVTRMTDPDWVPIMRISSGIITEEGGKTCHAAIISRELGIPCIVGAKDATKKLKANQAVTVDCTQGSEGRIFLGRVPFGVKRYDLKKTPKLKVKIMVNIGAPDIAFKTSFLPVQGVGLAREEFIIAEKIRIHPLALYHFNQLKNKKIKKEIEEITAGYKDKKEYFVEKLAEGIAQIGAAFYPKEVVVRFSDFKTNEYAALIGGEQFEPKEANPMLGWRGASRYYDEKFKPAFEMECLAIKRAREVFGLKNIVPMVPFCRTVEEGRKVVELIEKAGLKRGKDGLKIYVMCEIPSNVILAEEFLKIFDGMSIGSNDLTQLSLGIDRDSPRMARIGNENNEAVKEMIKKVIRLCNQKQKYSGICGQAPSDYPEFARFLMKEGIGSMSLNPDAVIKTILMLSKIK